MLTIFNTSPLPPGQLELVYWYTGKDEDDVKLRNHSTKTSKKKNSISDTIQ